MAYFDLE
jgi:histone-lysine N-methyltransferase SETD3